ncbi:MAG: hypothetical protein LBE85_03270 [Candidatus Accumulibacter sp.]|jgi:hypothetical protein|nr:hypothetical protein [Accumulibacter sp.]
MERKLFRHGDHGDTENAEKNEMNLSVFSRALHVEKALLDTSRIKWIRHELKELTHRIARHA